MVFITNRWRSINICWKTIIKNSKKKIRGTDIELLLEEISYEALPENLIEKVEIDLDGKTAGDTIRVKDLPIATAEGIHLKTNPEETVVQVTEVHNAPEEEETEEAAEE